MEWKCQKNFPRNREPERRTAARTRRDQVRRRVHPHERRSKEVARKVECFAERRRPADQEHFPRQRREAAKVQEQAVLWAEGRNRSAVVLCTKAYWQDDERAEKNGREIRKGAGDVCKAKQKFSIDSCVSFRWTSRFNKKGSATTKTPHWKQKLKQNNSSRRWRTLRRGRTWFGRKILRTKQSSTGSSMTLSTSNRFGMPCRVTGRNRRSWFSKWLPSESRRSKIWRHSAPTCESFRKSQRRRKTSNWEKLTRVGRFWKDIRRQSSSWFAVL